MPNGDWLHTIVRWSSLAAVLIATWVHHWGYNRYVWTQKTWCEALHISTVKKCFVHLKVNMETRKSRTLVRTCPLYSRPQVLSAQAAQVLHIWIKPVISYSLIEDNNILFNVHCIVSLPIVCVSLCGFSPDTCTVPRHARGTFYTLNLLHRSAWECKCLLAYMWSSDFLLAAEIDLKEVIWHWPQQPLPSSTVENGWVDAVEAKLKPRQCCGQNSFGFCSFTFVCCHIFCFDDL